MSNKAVITSNPKPNKREKVTGGGERDQERPREIKRERERKNRGRVVMRTEVLGTKLQLTVNVLYYNK